MEDRFSLLLSLRTPDGFEVFGEFGIGGDKVAVENLFDSLKGDEQLSDQAMLHIDLSDAAELLPEKVRTKCCRLEELACNCKLITREVFRQKNLESYEE